jgi:hypothetical protein
MDKLSGETANLFNLSKFLIANGKKDIYYKNVIKITNY